MPNWLENLRLQNIFNQPIIGNDLPSQGGIMGNLPPIGIGGGMPTSRNPFDNIFFGPDATATNTPPVASSNPVSGPMGNQPGMMDVGQRMSDLYQPANDASDRFDSLMQNYPQYERPGAWRTIAAILTDLKSGPEAGQRVMDFHNTRRMTDWKNQIGPAQQAANLERQENSNMRMLAYQTVSQELRAQADAERAKNNEVNANIRQQRADIYDFKSKNPGLKVIATKGGNVMLLNPADGKTTDTGIPSGVLSEADKITLGQENALERIQATGSQQRQTEGVRQAGRESIAETRGWQVYNVPDGSGGTKAVKINQITGEVRDLATPTGAITRPTNGGGRSTTAESPAVIRTKQATSARQIVNTNPELGKWVKFNGPYDFTVTPPTTGGGLFAKSGPTQQQYDQIRQLIYGDMPAIPQPGRTGDNGSVKTDTSSGSVVKPPSQGASTTADTPPQGAKPGGKWKQTKFGRVYVEP